MLADPGIDYRVSMLLIALDQAPYESAQWFETLDQIRSLGTDVIPCLVAIIEDTDWDRATHAAIALEKFGPLAVEFAPQVFAKLAESDKCHEDMFGIAGYEALVAMGPGSLEFMMEQVETGDDYECDNALWILDGTAPLTPKMFEFYTHRLLTGREREKGIVFQFLPKFTELTIETIRLATSKLLASDSLEVREDTLYAMAEASLESPSWAACLDSVINGENPEIVEIAKTAMSACQKDQDENRK